MSGRRNANLVKQEPSLSGWAEVRRDGSITLPLLNNIAVAGLTSKQLEKLLEQRLTRFVRTPSVTVLIANDGDDHHVHPQKWLSPLQAQTPSVSRYRRASPLGNRIDNLGQRG